MKLVVFGLTISSSWGNSHATLWRGLVRALARRGWHVIFFERDVPSYAEARDLSEIEGGEVVLYGEWDEIAPTASRHIADAEVALVTSCCPDGIPATDLVLASNCPAKLFYDIDTPVTLSLHRRGEAMHYIGPRGLGEFDLVLSYTGGRALDGLKSQFGAKAVEPLYGHVDPQIHKPADPVERYAADLSYIGAYTRDRQHILAALLLAPARKRPQSRFVIAGTPYPADFPWTSNIHFVQHLPPAEHPAFFASSRLTLNVTRRTMAELGWCPSVRLFEAAACGAPVLSDSWEGLDAFFEPGTEMLEATCCDDVLEALDRDPADLERIAVAARERVLAEHTSDHRAAEFERLLELNQAHSRQPSAG